MTMAVKETDPPSENSSPEVPATAEAVFIAPDGGWGWVIVFASALSNLIVIPIMQSFGLLFKDTFTEMGMSGTDCSVIINVNSAFGMGLGLINGPLQRRFGFRKVGMCAALLIFVGVTCTTWANSFVTFLITYSIITSLGISLVLSSFSLALNTYFKLRRGKAAGISMTATGLGPIVMPLLISFLIDTYGVQGTTLILGGMSLHAFVAALLLQPVKWHVKSAPAQVPAVQEDEKETLVDGLIEECDRNHTTTRPRTMTITSLDPEVDTQSIYGFETPLMEQTKTVTISSPISRRRYSGRMRLGRSISTTEEPDDRKRPANWFSSSRETVNLGSSIGIFDERNHELLDQDKRANTNRRSSRMMDDSQTPSKTRLFRSTINRIVVFFDLDLLKDPRYVCLAVGMSLAITAEINFSLLVPFIMGDLGFENRQIAIIMSTIATSDIIFRFVAPFIGDALHYSAKKMFFISLVLLILSRTTMTFFSTYTSILYVGVFLGIGKGVRTVYMTLVVPEYVQLERLPGASGIQMVTNGIFVLVFGPLLGVIRDWSGNYNTCILAINVLASVTLVIWTVEYLLSRYKSRRLASSAAMIDDYTAESVRQP